LKIRDIRRGNKWFFCYHLNQGITEAKDGALDKLKGFDSLEGMTGNSMKSIGTPVVVFLFTVYA
jgi:hypothetical protein